MNFDKNDLQQLQQLQFKQGDYTEFFNFFYGLVSLYTKNDAIYLHINIDDCILEYKFADDKINKLIYQAIRTFEPKVMLHNKNKFSENVFSITFRTQNIPNVYLTARERMDLPKRFYDIAKKYNIYIPQELIL